MLHSSKSAFSGHVPDDAKIDWHRLQRVMHVFHNKDTLSCSRQILAKLLMATDAWLVDLEMGTQVVNLYDANIVFFDDTTMRKRNRWHRQQPNQKRQSSSNHETILNMNFLFSTLALLLGPFIYALGRRNRAVRHGLDAFIIFAVAWIIGVHIIPESIETGGLLAIPFLAAGIAFPIVMQRVLHVATGTTHFAMTILAAMALALHAIIDGIALIPGYGEHLPAAVILHRLPVGMAIWWTFRPTIGRASAIAAFVIIIAATGSAFYSAAPVIELAESRNLALFQAFVSGSLIDLVASLGRQMWRTRAD
jgi:hypothetical protein